MNFIQQQTLLISSLFLVSCYVNAMEQEVPQISSTTVAVVEQENLQPNPLLKEFFVKSAWQEDFDQAQFYKSHPDMFGAKTDIPKTLPNLDPDVRENVLQYVFNYKKTALGFVRLNWGRFDYSKGVQSPLYSNLNIIRVKKEKRLHRRKPTRDVDVVFFDIDYNLCSNGFCITHCFMGEEPKNTYYRYQDIYNTHMQNYCTHFLFDGVNRYGYLIVLNNHEQSDVLEYNFSIFNTENPQKNESEEGYYLPKYRSEIFLGKATAVGLHYISNRFGVCSFDNTTSIARIGVYDFDMLLDAKNNQQLVSWQGVLPEKFVRCIFITASTLLGITHDGKLYSIALEKDKSISVYRQLLKDADKKDLVIEAIAVDYMDPRRVVFIDKEKNYLYLMDLKSKKNNFVKIQNNLRSGPIEYLLHGDGNIFMKYLGHEYSGWPIKSVLQQIDYIPY